MLVDTKGGNVLYLPLDKLVPKHITPVKLPQTETTAAVTESASKEQTASSLGGSRPDRVSYDAAKGVIDGY